MKSLTITFFFLCLTLSSVFSQAGRVGINTTEPQAVLHVVDSSIVFTGPSNVLSVPGAVPVSGPGNRTMWYADKAAFRTGGVTNDHWDRDYIGNFSFAGGNSTIAGASCSMAFGQGTKAMGTTSVALGFHTRALGFSSFTTGAHNEASGDYSAAMGHTNYATADFSTAFGQFSKASGYASTAMGYSSQAAGSMSFAFGQHLLANGYAGTVIGRYNDSIITTGNGPFSGNPLFIIGNGENSSQRRNAMVVRNDGRVGIGTNSPMSRFHTHVQGSNAQVARFSAEGAGYTEIVVANDTSEMDFGLLGPNGYLGTKTSGNLFFRTNALNRMSILHNGKVGIGPGIPTYMLDVGSSESDIVVGRFKSAGGYGVVSIGNPTHEMHIGVTQDNGYVHSVGERDLELWTNTNVQLVAKASTQRIGIGTENPLSKLHVHDHHIHSVIARFQNDGGYGEINVDNGTANVDFGVFDNDGYVGTKTNSDFYFRANAISRMIIKKTGNVGIGTSNPGSTLEVNGSASKPGGGNWAAASDARLKQNVGPYTDGLSTLMGIYPVTYQYNENSGFDVAQKHVGVIAQELLEIAPYMVTTSEKVMADGTNGYLQVDNSAMVYMLINAVKEQQLRIETLEQRIAILEQ